MLYYLDSSAWVKRPSVAYAATPADVSGSWQ
jgi:hypothetical protein